jgi:hypothetical protein
MIMMRICNYCNISTDNRGVQFLLNTQNCRDNRVRNELFVDKMMLNDLGISIS